MDGVDWAFVSAIAAIGSAIAATTTAVLIGRQRKDARDTRVVDNHIRINLMLLRFTELHNKMVRGEKQLLTASPDSSNAFSRKCYQEISAYYSMLEIIPSSYTTGIFSMAQIDDFFGDRLKEIGLCEIHSRLCRNAGFFHKHKRVYDFIDKLKSYRARASH